MNTKAKDMAASVELSDIDCTLPLVTLYAKVIFDTGDSA